MDEHRQAREEFAEKQMYEHCKAHNIDVPNHIIKDALRIGFDEGVKYRDKYVYELWLVIIILIVGLIAKCVF